MLRVAKRVKHPRAKGARLRPLIVRRSKGERIPKAFLENWLRDVSRALSVGSTSAKLGVKARKLLRSSEEVSLVFVSAKEIRRLNREYRSKDKATDVLSFAPTDEGSLGELVLCLDVIGKQAIEHGLSLQEELGYMVLHGVLHLLGYDHEQSARAAKQMFDIQDEIFEKLRGEF